MRLFFGVKPKSLKDNVQLKTVYSKIKRTIGEWNDPVRFTPPDQWHVTVLFLGETDPHELEKIKSLVSAWEPPRDIELSFSGLGAFPSDDHGRILWVGVRENKAFLRLQESLEEIFLSAGILKVSEREFKPHLTLARLRHARHLGSVIELARKTSFGKESLTELTLFESVTENHLPKYQALFSKPLQ